MTTCVVLLYTCYSVFCVLDKTCEFVIWCYMLSADQVYGDQEMNTVVRNHCMDYMVSPFFRGYARQDLINLYKAIVDYSFV